MAHWFHRNPLKATAPAGFDLRQVLTNGDCSKIASDSRLSRGRLLDHLTDPNNELEAVEAEMKQYLSLLYGFLYPLDGKGDDSKLRNLQKFKWTNTMLGYIPIESSDFWFETLNLLFNMALWYTKHAAKLAGKDEVSEEEAKEVHRCLRRAAGIFQFISQERSKVQSPQEDGIDLDPRILSAYQTQCTAEAQEVTVARAVELEHAPGLISALAYETAKLFDKADDGLKTLDPLSFEKWRKYLELKHQFYLAMAYSYRGEVILAEDKCGEGIRALKESMKHYEKAEALCQEYSKAKGPGSTVKPEKHMFFRRLRPILQRTLDKCERENGFIYHQKVPEEVPELEGKATHGLVKPEEYSLPSPHELWCQKTYENMDISKATMPDFKNPKKSDKELKPVKEVPIYQSDKDPLNCVIS